MNEHERYLVSLLRNAFDGDIEKGIKEFEAYYWPVTEEVSWNSKVGAAIHTLAQDLEYFEPKAEWRTDPMLYDHEELRRRIHQVLVVVPSE